MKYEGWGQIDPRRKRLTSESPALLGLKNKFEMLRELVQDKLDILLISETKADQSFPSCQLVLKGLVLHFDLTEIAQDVTLCYLLWVKTLK